MAKTKAERDPIASIVVQASSKYRNQPVDEWVSSFENMHEAELRLAVQTKLQTAGYDVQADAQRLDVRRTNNSTPVVYVKLARSYVGRSWDSSLAGVSVRVSLDSWGYGSRRIPMPLKVTRQGSAHTYTFSTYWQSVLKAVEEELSTAECVHQFDVARQNAQQAKVDAAAHLFGPASQLKLHENVGKVKLDAHTGNEGYTIEVDVNGLLTGAVLLPYLQLFPTAVVEVRSGDLRLSYLSLDDIKKGLDSAVAR